MSTPDRPEETISTVRVSGMTCEHCVSSVSKELTALASVQKVDVDLSPGGISTVRITADRPLSDIEISEAIAEAGYLVRAEEA
ncbi:heavy-metal-associated domain-containing protein [Acaricomes phytoseiuli]|uniref:heavy-metal-associated domain-containing protein n=1 Tax=Acaricomes phytoseiuli TaxID=291968 RepID=UPI00037BD238|nr:cation transporter [Acaricomes phytoseiuli]